MQAGEPALQKQFFGHFSAMARFASLLPGLSNWFSNLGMSRVCSSRLRRRQAARHPPVRAEDTLAAVRRLRPIRRDPPCRGESEEGCALHGRLHAVQQSPRGYGGDKSFRQTRNICCADPCDGGRAGGTLTGARGNGRAKRPECRGTS